MSRNTIYQSTGHLTIAAIFTIVAACSSEEISVTHPEEEGKTLTIIAEVARQVHSRATADEYITKGTYYLTYPPASGNLTHNVAPVKFGNSDMDPGFGVVSVPEEKGLKWSGIKNESITTFYLDNVDPVDNQGEPSLTIVFDDNNNPYKAGILSEENDLLWGVTEVARNTTNTIFFDLHHYMAGIKVEVTVDPTYAEEGELNLEGAVVEISSIRQTPISYNRLDGSLELPTVSQETGEEYDKVYQTLTLVDESKKEGAEGRIEWFETKENGDNLTKTYVTQNFVLPPQDLLENEYRPHLIIKKDGKEYSGILPHTMFLYNGNYENYPVTLSFLKEHILTIRTLISEDPPELAFAPVEVVQWVDKGEFDLEAHQAGIYKAEEFYKLIEYYNDNNEYQLVRYGRKDESGEWVFDFFSSVTLEDGKVRGKITNGPTGFSFNFNGYSVYIGSQQVSDSELHQILTGGN